MVEVFISEENNKEPQHQPLGSIISVWFLQFAPTYAFTQYSQHELFQYT